MRLWWRIGYKVTLLLNAKGREIRQIFNDELLDIEAKDGEEYDR